LEAQYSFMEESGASAEDLNAKSAEIQTKLHEINELARATGASEEDILKTSQKWWTELKKIHEVQRDVYQNERNLLQSEADLMEHQNKSASERIAKLRQIQDSLHREAEYMRSIKASQAEINQLSIQWWEIESNIRAIQQDLVDQLNSAISARLDQVGDQKDDAIDRLRDDIDALERERDARIASELGEKKAWIEEEEKAIKAIRREQEIAKENQAIADAETDIQEKKVKLLEAEKTQVFKSGYFARSAAPCKKDLELIHKCCELAVKSALDGVGGVVGKDEDDSNTIRACEFTRVKGGKPFNVRNSRFRKMLREIGQPRVRKTRIVKK
jgi:uncharacterized protein (DUF3084 family)